MRGAYGAIPAERLTEACAECVRIVALRRHTVVRVMSLMNSFTRTTAVDATRLVPARVCAWACFALTLVVPATQRSVWKSQSEHSIAEPQSSATRSDSHPSAPAVFRLGDAAKPFGWSTVIGDFNTDRKPDIVVADHIARHAGRYAYRLVFSVSGQPPQNVTFESSHDAITVSVADVDCDHDLDVIVGVPLSGQTVGIWLNDSRGHFTAGEVRRLPGTIRPLQSLSITDPLSADELPSWRAGGALPAVFGATLAHSAHRSIVLRSQTVRSALPSTRRSPRAPPSALLDLLS